MPGETLLKVVGFGAQISDQLDEAVVFFEVPDEVVDLPINFVKFLLCKSHVVKWRQSNGCRMVDGWRVKRLFDVEFAVKLIATVGFLWFVVCVWEMSQLWRIF